MNSLYIFHAHPALHPQLRTLWCLMRPLGCVSDYVWVFVSTAAVIFSLNTSARKSDVLHLSLNRAVSSKSSAALASFASTLSSIKEIYVDCKIAICLSADKLRVPHSLMAYGLSALPNSAWSLLFNIFKVVIIPSIKNFQGLEFSFEMRHNVTFILTNLLITKGVTFRC